MPSLPSSRPLEAASLPVLALALALVTSSCGETSPPVARLAAEPSSVHLPFPEAATVELRWSPLVASSELSGTPVAFVHLVDSRGDLLRTFDHPIDMASWVVGKDLLDPVELDHSFLAPHLPPGDYLLTAGLYDPLARRFPLEVQDEVGAGLEYEVATVVVPDQRFQTQIGFRGDWQPPEDSGDRQSVVHRWLGSKGAIELGIVDSGQLLGLRLRIPSEIPDAELTMPGIPEGDPEAPDDPQSRASDPPLLAVASNCGDGFAIDEIGSHRLVLAIEPTTPPTACRITLTASAFWVGPRGVRRSASLESLTLTPVDVPSR